MVLILAVPFVCVTSVRNTDIPICCFIISVFLSFLYFCIWMVVVVSLNICLLSMGIFIIFILLMFIKRGTYVDSNA
jgi:hypothetical protein